MLKIEKNDWNFDAIRTADAERANRLESAVASADLINELVMALKAAINEDQLRIAVDSKRNEFVECRTIFQFPVNPSLYDWFFNARTGYRAQFWLSPETGMNFNHQIVESLTKVLSNGLPSMVSARKIEVHPEGESRTEKYAGTVEEPRGEILKSLVPEASKIWICERRYGVEGTEPEEIGLAVLADAARTSAKLNIPRWAEATNPKTSEKAEGLRAPSPDAECSWLDLKGGFVGLDGKVFQCKPQDKRANDIHRRGWT